MNKKKSILVTAPLDFLQDLKKQIENEFNCTYAYQAGKDETKKLLRENEFEGWLVSPCPTYLVNHEIMSCCPSLKIIATPSTGSNHIDIPDAEKNNIHVFALKGTDVIDNIFASSEFTFNLLISTIRNTPYSFNAVKEGNWRDIEEKFRGRELNGLKLGIIGFGRIGKNLAKYSNAFGMEIYAYDPYVKINSGYVDQQDNLNEMLEFCDAVAVCVHLNPETFKMINEDIFSRMKDGVFFVNTARGDVIDEQAFLKYLKNGKIKAAGVDVISDEYTTSKDDHPLINYCKENSNLIITPHIAGLTYDSERKAQSAAYEAIKKYIDY